jgi:hypothetical protein
MTENVKKTIIQFAKNYYPIKDLDFVIREVNNDFFLTLVVDVAKMDINSGQYDEGYFNLVTEKQKKRNFIDAISGANFLTPISAKLDKFMGIRVRPAFEFKNYEYLDNVHDKIELAIKKSSNPNIDIEFTADWDKPKVILKFYGLSQELFEGENFEPFFEELKNILKSKISFECYIISRTTSKK